MIPQEKKTVSKSSVCVSEFVKTLHVHINTLKLLSIEYRGPTDRISTFDLDF